MVSVCGIFLAGAIAFARTMSDAATICEKGTLSLTVILLVISVASALNVLRLKTVYAAPLGDELAGLVDDLIKSDQINEDSVESLMHDHSNLWKNANKDIHTVNNDKAESLKYAQFFLSFSIIVAVIFILIKIW